MILIRWALAALLLAAAPALAQNASSVTFPAGSAPGMSLCVKQLDGSCKPVAVDYPLPISGGGGGGGGGDPSSTGVAGSTTAPANVLMMGGFDGTIVRRLLTDSSGRLTIVVNALPALAAGANTIGGVTQSGTWNVGITATPTMNLGTLGGAATNAAQTAVQSAPGTSATTAVTVQGATAGVALPVNAVLRVTTTNRSAVVGTTATNLMAANTSRQGFAIQVQGSGACYINGLATATADQNSLMIPAGGYFETTTHVGTGAVSIICTVASTPVWAREW